MQELDDIALLREYAEHDSEEAFAVLVTRHVNKVYSVAWRHTRNPHSAEEITQAVFVILAQKARQLDKRVILSGWMYQTARLTSVTFIRSEIRRSRREEEAYMQTLTNENEADVWPQIAPLLDAGMAGLNEADRHTIVLRFFDGKSMREIGDTLGANEDTARKRVNRAVERLRKFFTKRGVVVPAAVLTRTISTNSVQAAPATLAKTVTAIALAKGATASLSTLTLVKVATIKSAATLGAGSLSGLFAILGSAYVSLKARADDSKSPRERQFIIRMFRTRIAIYLLWVAAYFVAREFNFFHTPLCFDFFAAAFAFYFFCIDSMILAREQNLRRRQIQIEDNTYVEAEWTMPRKVTDPTTDSVKAKNILKMIKFSAFDRVFGAICIVISFLMFRKLHYAHIRPWILIWTASFVIGFFVNFRRWQRRSRFVKTGGDGPSPPRIFILFPIIFPIVIGLITLAIFDLYQCLPDYGRHDSTLISPNEVLIFNGVVVLVYTAFTIRTMGILARRRERMGKSENLSAGIEP